MQDVDLPAEELRIGVRQHPLDAVHGVQLGVGGIGEEAVVVLLGMEEVLDVAVPEDLADPIDVLGAVGEPVGDRSGRRVDHVSEGAERREVAREAHRLHAERLQEREQVLSRRRRRGAWIGRD